MKKTIQPATMTWPKLRFFSILVGNIFEHYDKSLYSILAPFIAHLFFPNLPILTTLAIAYFPFGLVFRPLGALFFGYFGNRYGGEKVLFYSLIGVALTSISIGALPTYSEIGIAAPVALSFLRGTMQFFAAGEQTSAPLMLLKRVPKKQRALWSSFYEMSSIGGVIIGSCLALLMLHFDTIEKWWRLCFFMGGILSLLPVYLRRNLSHSRMSGKIDFLSIWNHLPQFIGIICVTGFLCANYDVLSVIMNALLPKIGITTEKGALAFYAALLIFDFFTLPIVGNIANRCGSERVMKTALFIYIGAIFPLFATVNINSALSIAFLRISLVLMGVAVCAPYQNWLRKVAPQKGGYSIIALGKAIGAQGIGAPAISLSIWAFKTQNSLHFIPCYLTAISVAALVSITALEKKNAKALQPL